MLLFVIRWFIRIMNLINEGEKDKLFKKQKKTIKPFISQDRIKIKILK